MSDRVIADPWSHMVFVDQIESPSYCALGCTDRLTLRFFFSYQSADYSYSVTIRKSDERVERRRAFEELLTVFGFNIAEQTSILGRIRRLWDG